MGILNRVKDSMSSQADLSNNLIDEILKKDFIVSKWYEKLAYIIAAIMLSPFFIIGAIISWLKKVNQQQKKLQK